MHNENILGGEKGEKTILASKYRAAKAGLISAKGNGGKITGASKYRAAKAGHISAKHIQVDHNMIFYEKRKSSCDECHTKLKTTTT